MRSLVVLAILVVGCSSTADSAPVPPGAAAEAPPGTEPAPSDPVAPVVAPKIPPTTPNAPPSERPPPQSSIRDCGGTNATPSRADTRLTVPSFYEVPVGAFVLPGVVVSTSVWASGEASRASTGVTATTTQTSDAKAADFVARLMIPPAARDASGAGTYSNLVEASDAGQWGIIDASSGILTYGEGFGQREVGWSIASPKRTSSTSKVGTDLFARGLIPGRFFGYQIAIVIPSACALGALSDAEKRPAILTDGTTKIGVFDPATMADVQKVLVQNEATIFVRVVANKPNQAATDLLASTACSTGDLAACQKLMTDLREISQGLTSAAPSQLAALQAGTDPSWTTVEYSASQVSILED